MSSLPEDLGVLLSSAGLTNIKYGHLPATADDVIMIRQTTGLEPLRTHDDLIYEQIRAQVIIRTTTYQIGYARAYTAWKALFKQNILLNGTVYLAIRPVGSPADLGVDEQNPPRRLFDFNVEILRKLP